MNRLCCLALALSLILGCRPKLVADALVDKIRAELEGPLTADSQPHPGRPKGELIDGTVRSALYPGSEHRFRVYVPAQYRAHRPACLLINLDGISEPETLALDNLTAEGALPVIIGVGVAPGTAGGAAGGQPSRFNRSYEFDSISDTFAQYVLGDLLPRVQQLRTKDGRPIRLSERAADRAVVGASTGGIGAFTLAWQRPDSFSRVYSVIGTFVSMRGGDSYFSLVRKFEPKPIRIFLEDGSQDAWNPLFGSWYTANLNLEAALSFSGYQVEHAWGHHAHTSKPGITIFPDVMRWLWRGWPAAVTAGPSQNDLQQEILLPGQGWEPVGAPRPAIRALASNRAGDVFFSSAAERSLQFAAADGTVRTFATGVPVLTGLAWDAEGQLYGACPEESRLIVFSASGQLRTFAKGIRAHSLLADYHHRLLATEPGLHPDEPSTLWSLGPDGARVALDRGLASASALAASPDHALVFAAESSTQWIYSYLSASDGTLAGKQRYYWLHQTDLPNNSGAEEMVVDRTGRLYVATRLGIQVCDRNGRVRAILPLPGPARAVLSVCWGGPQFDQLYATDGQRLFRRRLKTTGYSQWEPPQALPPGAAG